MLPTPSTSHVDFDRIYEPAEDSYLLLDTLSSAAETHFLTERFGGTAVTHTQAPADFTPLIVEVGTGSGVLLAFITANASAIFGRRDVLAIGTDINGFACRATRQTVLRARDDVNSERTNSERHHQGFPVISDVVRADLTGPLRHGSVDVLIFNPPYVPTEDISPLIVDGNHTDYKRGDSEADVLQSNTDLLSLSYAGGVDGMEVTNRLLEQLPTCFEPKTRRSLHLTLSTEQAR